MPQGTECPKGHTVSRALICPRGRGLSRPAPTPGCWVKMGQIRLLWLEGGATLTLELTLSLYFPVNVHEGGAPYIEVALFGLVSSVSNLANLLFKTV